MTIEVGTDPNLPVALTCGYHSSGGLEVKYGGQSITHPEADDLRVDLEQLDLAAFQTADFSVGGVLHTVSAAIVDGASWNSEGSTIASGDLDGDADPGKLHEVDVTATNTATNETKTVRIRLRIREQSIRPLPTGP